MISLFMKTASEKPYEYQSEYYCKQNFIKFLIADVGLSMPDQIFTSVDVENQTGIHRKKAGNALWHYKKVGIPYFRRLLKKALNGLIRWKVTNLEKKRGGHISRESSVASILIDIDHK